MGTVLIVYGSSMGNTESVAETIQDVLENADFDVTAQNVNETSAEDVKNYDYLLVGCSTWGDGELWDDFVPFHDELSTISLQGKKGAVFGCGDSNYPQFCNAVDIIERTLTRSGMETAIKSLKIDIVKGDVDEQIDTIEEWAQKLADSLQ
ncbi:flavodoxin [bacterium]|nr:flavodoxin [bacterium]MCP5462881.1 flavodoxin [bacterium]